MMAEEEEDVLFDQAGLLSHRVKTLPEIQGGSLRVFTTICLCSAFFGLGLCIAIPGPTLLDLQQQTQTDTEEITTIFTGRSIGYLVGSIVGGFLFDKLNQPCLLTLALLLTAVGTAGAPWCTNFMLLMAIFAVQGVSMGFLDTGGNVLCLYTWGRKSAPYLQTLHFAFGLGAFVAPLVAEPFLSTGTNVTVLINDTNATLPPSQMIHIPMDKASIHVHKRFFGIIENEMDIDEGLEGLVNNLENRYRRETGALNPLGGNTGKSDTYNATDDSPKEPPKGKPKNTGGGIDSDTEKANGNFLSKTLKKKDKQNAEKDQIVTSTSVKPPEVEAKNGSNIPPYKPLETSTSSSTTSAMTTTTTTRKPYATTKSTTTTIATTTMTKQSMNITSSDSSNSTNAEDDSGDSGMGNIQKVVEQVSTTVKQFTQVLMTLSKVQFAYLAIALFNFLVSFMFLTLCCKGNRSLKAIKNQDIQPEYIVRKENKGFRVQILFMLAVFYFLYVGMEVTYGGLLMTFAVKYLDWSKAKGSLLTSVFWGSFAAGRGLAIFLAKCLNPPIMVIADLVLCCLALVGLVMGLETNHTIIWFCTAVLGVGMSSIFPTGITWAERYMHVTGKATSIFVVGSALGAMSMPALTGFMFEMKGEMWMLYILLASSLISVVLYIFMQNLASNMGDRYQRLSQMLANSTLSETTSIDLEMDALPVSNHSEVFNAGEEENHELGGRSKKKVTFNLSNGQAARNGKKPGKGSILKGKGSGPKQD